MGIPAHSLQETIMSMYNDLLPDDTGIDIIDIRPETMHLGGTKLDDTLLRFDSMTYPEFYVEVDTTTLSTAHSTTVKGRFSDELFAGGSMTYPQSRWIVQGTELLVHSPGMECSFRIRLS